jgi:hypothetical protein
MSPMEATLLYHDTTNSPTEEESKNRQSKEKILLPFLDFCDSAVDRLTSKMVSYRFII